jgi:hypothetical protein
MSAEKRQVQENTRPIEQPLALLNGGVVCPGEFDDFCKSAASKPRPA